ncbi:MAG: NAD+ synthase, partial [Deltaproteobacteria bacterium]|nr:NAD+ synthase [Deltaproteobacteria bacterium]
MKITLAQLNPVVGDVRYNLSKALDALSESQKDHPDLVIFPELFLVGYPPQDLVEGHWFIDQEQKVLEELIEASNQYGETGILIGAVQPAEDDVGRGIYNSAVLIYRGEV